MRLSKRPGRVAIVADSMPRCDLCHSISSEPGAEYTQQVECNSFHVDGGVAERATRWA